MTSATLAPVQETGRDKQRNKQRRTWIAGRLDPLGGVIAVFIVWGLLEPFVSVRANRIVAGVDLGWGQIFPGWQAGLPYALGVASAGFALARTSARWRFGASVVLLAGLALGLGWLPGYLARVGAQVSALTSDALARISPAMGAWLLAGAYGVLLVDALARLKPGPLARCALLAAALAASGALLHGGWWDGLSIMQEYAVRADAFWQEMLRHVELAAGAVGAALFAGVPLGIVAARHALARNALLAFLNIVQTIPGIALFGLMMAPLGFIAARVPFAAALGISGIGAAPAGIALFLYALLPVVSTVALGLTQAPRDMLEAATAMGMTAAQKLWRVEFPLALPVVLGGVRIALVQGIALVTIAALIGGGGLGTFIFQGIGQAATDLVLLGALPTIGLALVAACVFDVAIAAAKGRISKDRTLKARALKGQTLKELTLKGQTLKERASEGQALKDQTPKGLTLKGQTLKERAPEGQTLKGLTPERQALKGRTLKERAPEGQTVKKQTPKGQTPEGQV